MKRIYYIEGCIEQKIVNYLESAGMSSISFIGLNERNISRDSYGKEYFSIHEDKAILIWGSGTKHHFSYFFSPSKPYFKSVDDAHDDLNVILDKNKINFGNHNRVLLMNDNNLSGIEILGVRLRYMDDISMGNINKEKNNPSFLKVSYHLASQLTGQSVHKSIDLDVVADFPCHPDHACGGKSFSAIKTNFEELLKKNNVLRFDVGGLDLKSKKSLRNDHGFLEYKELIEMYLDHNA